MNDNTDILKKNRRKVFIIFGILISVLLLCLLARVLLFDYIFNRANNDYIFSPPSYFYVENKGLYYCEKAKVLKWWEYDFNEQKWQEYDGTKIYNVPTFFILTFLFDDLKKIEYENVSDELLKRINIDFGKSLNIEDLIFD